MNKGLNKIICVFMFFIFTFYYCVSVKAETTGNNYPIILVNGMAGMERDKMFGLKYYGGLHDIQDILTKKGYKTLSAFAGPFDSDWDQACEIYYYIKGGTVDYGAYHSKKYGHARFGKTFKGIYPEWNETNKVHFVGFSTGGTSTRLLDEFLRNGDSYEKAYYADHPEEGISPLFEESNRVWVKSITSLATAHGGSTAFEIYQRNPITLKEFILNMASMSESVYASPAIYDFGMQHWGLRRNPGETINSFVNRIFASNVWKSEDTCFYTLTRKGAEYLDQKTSIHDDMYYFSYHGDSTYRGKNGNYYPIASTNILYVYGAYAIGSNNDKTLPFGYENWKASDGAANVISAQHPFNQPYRYYDGTIQEGMWNVYPTLKGWDHFDFLGITHVNDFDPIEELYTNIARTVRSLPI